MKPIALLLVAAMALSACSAGRSVVSRIASPSSPTMFATGPIYSACRSAGREQASRQRCGCVQAVANRELNANDQRRGAGFFSNPQQAQEVRQSDRAIDERFWRRWKDYSDTAARMCT